MSYTPNTLIAPTTITTLDAKYSQAGRQYAAGGGALASVAWTTANLAMYFPIEVPVACTLAQLFCWNGATAAGNVDVGLYNAAGTRIISATPTAMSGTNTLQFFNVADTPLTAGLHYLALAASDGTATFYAMNPANIGFTKSTGALQQAAAGTLPSSMTGVTVTKSDLAVVGFTTLATL